MLPNENLKNLSPKYGQKKNRNYANVSLKETGMAFKEYDPHPSFFDLEVK